MSTPTMHKGQETLLESPHPPESRNSKPPPAGTRLDEEHIHGMVKESTVWDLYNHEARQVDHELVKDWTASLNFLLVLVSPLLPFIIHCTYLYRRASLRPCSPHLSSRARRCWNQTKLRSSSTLPYNISTL